MSVPDHVQRLLVKLEYIAMIGKDAKPNLGDGSFASAQSWRDSVLRWLRGENRREHWAKGGFLTITGDVGTYCGPEAVGIDWMSGHEMSEAIPPAYAEYIGRAAMAYIRGSSTNKEGD